MDLGLDLRGRCGSGRGWGWGLLGCGGVTYLEARRKMRRPHRDIAMMSHRKHKKRHVGSMKMDPDMDMGQSIYERMRTWTRQGHGKKII